MLYFTPYLLVLWLLMFSSFIN